MSKKVIVVGAGAAGFMAAGTAASLGAQVVLVERNDKVARKVMITGKGRCNVTNNCNLLNDLIANVPVNGRFLYSAFSRFMPDDTMTFFENMGVELKVERGNRVFPVSDKAVDIVDALNSFAKQNGVKRIQGRVSELIIENGTLKGVKTVDGTEIEGESVIVATGGMSYPQTGSTGDGYKLAEQAGHTVIEPKPALVPLAVHENWCSSLMGLSLRNCAVRFVDTDNFREVYSDFGEMLFTHFGVSGPVILSASSHLKNMKKGKYELYIDLKPALSEEQLDLRLQRDFAKNSNKDFINSLGELLPQKMIPVIVKLSGIPSHLKSNQITRDMRHDLAYLLKNLKLTVTDFRPIEEAIVTSGGVSTKEIEPKTMQSKLLQGLYFAGEVIDVDAYTGGFNLQIAFSTGHLAGENCVD